MNNKSNNINVPTKKSKKKKINKKFLRVFIVISAVILVGLVILMNKSLNKLKVEYKENVTLSINEEAYNIDNFKNIKNGTIVTEKTQIDTTKTGTMKITVTIEDKFHNEHDYTYNITIQDTEAPVITTEKDIIETTVGVKVSLIKDVFVKDNSLEKIDVTVEGEYDINKSGEYKLYYTAQDSNGNVAKKEFTLIVKEKDNTNSNHNNNNPNNNNDNNANNNNSNNNNNNNNNSTSSTTNKSFTTSKGFKGEIKNGVTYINGLVIANKTYGLPSSYGKEFGNSLTSETKNAFDKMTAAAALDGLTIRCQSGFRSYATQNNLYNKYVARDGQVEADIYSARPGHSEHQTGLACDVCSNDSSKCINSDFNNTAEAKWAAKNAYKYGLILRYPEGKSNETGYKYESWHFRYVGEELATKLYNNGDWITLENYFGITSEYK